MITFNQVKMKNFLSVGEEPLIFHLDKSPTTIISGSNGVGKTSIIDAITFSLFGKSFREIKKGSLINSVNQKNSFAEIKFTKGNTSYTILRGQKPHKLEITCNGMLMEENPSVIETQKYIEKQILGFDFNTFIRVCIMSTMNYTPFMSLSSYERRNFVENMLNLKMFSEMNKLHKAETILLKDEIQAIDSALNVIDTKLTEKHNFIEYIKTNTDDDMKSYQASLLENELELKEIEDKLSQLSGKESLIQKPLTVETEKLTEIQNEIYKIKSARSVNESKVSENNKTISYIENHDDCDLCKQKITDENSDAIIKNLASINSLLTESYDVSTVLSKSLYDSKDKIEIKISGYTTLKNQLAQKINGSNSSANIIRRNISSINTNIENLQKKSLLNSDEVEKEVKELQQRHNEMKEEFETKTEELKIANTLHELLKDTGIKADIIKQYIPMLCAYVNSYLSKLNISLTFDMDENFNEVISTIYADNFTYNNLSAGERTRLDLALAFSWMQVAKAKGSVDTNLLILDEVLDANLDESGTLAAFDIVNDISKNGSNVFIVSHKANLEEHVTSVLSLEKTDGFTQII